MDISKITLACLAVTVSSLVSIMGYQFIVTNQNHNHDDDYSANFYNFVSPTKYQGQIRTYYIAADEINWNYAPTGMNMITGTILSDDPVASVYTINGKDRIGSTYLKCLYREYLDDRFNKKKT